MLLLLFQENWKTDHVCNDIVVSLIKTPDVVITIEELVLV